jgi:LysM repeat protein
MKRREMVVIIVVNAILSALISTLVAVLVVITAPRLVGSRQAGPVVDIASQPTGLASAPEPTTVQAVSNVEPTSTPIVYTVQTGDTISSLSLQFDVPGADIIAANGIENPDYLPTGAELIIPVGGLPPATPGWTPVPTATYTPMPFEPPSADLTAAASMPTSAVAEATATVALLASGFRVEISEILGVGELEQEQVVIVNAGDQVADMAGWTLSGADGDSYQFRGYRLWPGGSVIVHSRAGQDGQPLSSLFWGRSEPAWAAGEVVALRNAEGEVLATYVVGF